MDLKDDVIAYLEAYKVLEETKQGSFKVSQLRNKIKTHVYHLEEMVGRELALQYIEKQDLLTLLGAPTLTHSVVNLAKISFTIKETYISLDEAIAHAYLEEYKNDDNWLEEWRNFREFMLLVENFQHDNKAKDRLKTFKRLISSVWVARMQNAFEKIDLNTLTWNDKERTRHISYFTAMLLNATDNTILFFQSIIEKASNSELIFTLYQSIKFSSIPYPALVPIIADKYENKLTSSVGYKLLKGAKLPVKSENNWHINITIDSEIHKHKLLLVMKFPSKHNYQLIIEEGHSRSFFPVQEGRKNKIIENFPLDCTADNVMPYFQKIAKQLDWKLKEESLKVEYGTHIQAKKIENYIKKVKAVTKSRVNRSEEQKLFLEEYIENETVDYEVSEKVYELIIKLPKDLPVELVEKVLLKYGIHGLYGYVHKLPSNYVSTLYKVVQTFIETEKYVSHLSLHYIIIALQRYQDHGDITRLKKALTYLVHLHKFVKAKYQKSEFEKVDAKISTEVVDICYTLLSSKTVKKEQITDEMYTNEEIIYHNFFVYPFVFMNDKRLLEVSKKQVSALFDNFDIYRFAAPVFNWKDKTNVIETYKYLSQLLKERTVSNFSSKWLSQFNVTLEPDTSWYVQIAVGNDSEEKNPSFSTKHVSIILSNIIDKYVEIEFRTKKENEREELKSLKDLKEVVGIANEWAKKENTVLYWEKARIDFYIHPIKTMKPPTGLKKEIKKWLLN